MVVKKQDSDIQCQNIAHPQKPVLLTVMGCSIADTENHSVHVIIRRPELCNWKNNDIELLYMLQ